MHRIYILSIKCEYSFHLVCDFFLCVFFLFIYFTKGMLIALTFAPACAKPLFCNNVKLAYKLLSSGRRR